MKKLFTLGLLCGLALSLNAQYMKLDASFYSQSLDEIKKVDIYLPSDYYENLEQEYAVIYYLHGAGGDQNEGHTFATRYYILHGQDTTIATPPAMFVCPDGSCEPYSGSDWLNSELYGNYSDYFITDIIEFIESNFRVLTNREFRFICGTSMGGFGSAFHATNRPDLFRASFPFIGFPHVSESLVLFWSNLVYEENGSYIDINSSAGTYTRLALTMAGGVSPNMDMPNFVELPWDSLGALNDTVFAKWKRYGASAKVRDIPQDIELPFFLGCGMSDEMGTYPLYLQFEDSLTKYGIPYQAHYFDGGHEDDFVTWQKGFHWMDSIIQYSFQTMGVDIVPFDKSVFNIYPNPVHNELNINVEDTGLDIVSVSVYNQLGQLVLREQGYKSQLIVSGLKNGVYFVRVATQTNTSTKKFIKY